MNVQPETSPDRLAEEATISVGLLSKAVERFAEEYLPPEPVDLEWEASQLSESLDGIGKAVDRNFTSPNEADRNFEPANVVDGLFAIARGLHSVANAIESDGEDDRES